MANIGVGGGKIIRTGIGCSRGTAGSRAMVTTMTSTDNGWNISIV